MRSHLETLSMLLLSLIICLRPSWWPPQSSFKWTFCTLSGFISAVFGYPGSLSGCSRQLFTFSSSSDNQDHPFRSLWKSQITLTKSSSSLLVWMVVSRLYLFLQFHNPLQGSNIQNLFLRFSFEFRENFSLIENFVHKNSLAYTNKCHPCVT